MSRDYLEEDVKKLETDIEKLLAAFVDRTGYRALCITPTWPELRNRKRQLPEKEVDVSIILEDLT